MSSPTATISLSRPRLLERVSTAPVALTALVVVGAFARLVLSLDRATPRYLPDEFLYGQLARSLADGEGVSVLGQHSSFPALLEPLLTAAFWLPADAELAYRLTQTLHAVAMALAAVPVYLLARRLLLSPAYALACAAVAVATPGLLYVGYMTADALGYLFALVAVHACIRAVAQPSRKAEAWALAAIAFATTTRLQYAVLLPTYALAAIVVERGRPRRIAARFPLLTGALALGLVAAAVAGPALLGRYRSVVSFDLSGDAAHWILTNGTLLTFAVGVATVPGAVAWLGARLAAPGDRARKGFAALTASLTAALVVAAALIAVETDTLRFLERYLIVLAPLVAVAFCCWAEEGRPWRHVALGTASVLIVVAARNSLAEHVTGQGRADSPFLLAVGRLVDAWSLSSATFVAALVATAAALVAGGSALTPRVRPLVVLGGAIALLAAVSVGAHAADARGSQSFRARAFSGVPDWVDMAANGRDVLLVQTPWSSRFNAMIVSLWNPSITRASSLGAEIDPFDGLGRPLQLRADGTLSEHGEPVVGPVVLANTGTATSFEVGARVLRGRLFTFVDPAGPVRLTALAEGVRGDGFLGPRGRLIAFPARSGRCTKIRLGVTLPAGFPSTVLVLSRADGSTQRLRLQPNEPAVVTLTSGPRAGRSLEYRAERGPIDPFSPLVQIAAQASFGTLEADCD